MNYSIDFGKIKNEELLKIMSSIDDNSSCPVFFNDKNFKQYVILPGFCDVHVHFREPGFSYKESIKTGSLAASRGGYTTVLTMPNLNPVPDCLSNLKIQTDIIKNDSVVEIIPYGAITKGQGGKELSDMQELSAYVCAFSDDGRGVQNQQMMQSALLKAKKLNKLIVAHCEDNSLLKGGYIHDGEYAKKNNHRGICSESEYLPIKRDIELLKKTDAGYHVCHVSTKVSVELIRKAKKDGINITAETAPHYLLMTDADLKEDGNYKMNPPVRSEEDKKALIEGVLDGTIDIIATDHAPHSKEEKSKGLEKSPFGIVGLETAFALLYTNFVKTGIMTIEKLVELLSVNSRKRFNIKQRKNDFTVFEISTPYKIDSSEFLSQGKNTPFNGTEVYGKCVLTVLDGKVIFQD